MNVTHPDHDRLQQSAKDNLVLHFSKQEIDDLLVLDRGEGPYVYDTDGQQLHRRPVEPVLLAARLLLRRRDGRGRDASS